MDQTLKSFMSLSPKDRTTLLTEILTQYEAQHTIELFCCDKCKALGYDVPDQISEEFLTCKDCNSTFCKDCAEEKIYRKVCENCTKCVCKKCAKRIGKTCGKCKVFFCGGCAADSFNLHGRSICFDCEDEEDRNMKNA